MPARTFAIAAIMFTTFALSGCREHLPSKASSATEPNVDEWHTYNDPRYSLDELHAVRVATDEMAQPKGSPPNFNQLYRYEVKHDQEGWFVTVWHISGFKKGRPQFQPGGYTDFQLDVNFKVVMKMPGE